MPSSEPPVIDDPLFFLDYDGTLAPIVERPGDAFPHPDIPEILEELSEKHPVWIVTGRHLRDIERFLPGLPVQAIGLHGAQRGLLGESIEHHMSEEQAEVIEQLRARVPEGEGIRVEDKETTFAVHYRQAPDWDKARRMLEAWAEDVPTDFAVIWGKAVVELRPKGKHKGSAVLEVAQQYDGLTPMYIGDDVTDEDAFEALAGTGITIKVGEGETRAQYRLTNVAAVVGYLGAYL